MRRRELAIYCMCESAIRPAMWALYADKGRGICIKLDATVPPFALSRRVVYQEELAELPVLFDFEDQAQVDFAIQQMLPLPAQGFDRPIVPCAIEFLV